MTGFLTLISVPDPPTEMDVQFHGKEATTVIIQALRTVYIVIGFGQIAVAVIGGMILNMMALFGRVVLEVWGRGD